MAKFKKALLISVASVLVAAMAIGGTLAYLTDNDSDVNVMTLGNVSIAQHEYERVVDANGDYVVDSSVGGYKLQPFTQDKPLYPATIPTNSAEWTYGSTNAMFEQVGANGGGMNVFVEPNAVDKFVFVENTGKTDAYVRTLIAFESGSLSVVEWDEVVSSSYHFSWGDPVTIGSITVENNNYVVLEYTYKGRPDKGFHENGILPAGEVTQCSLGQVYLRSTATNEDMKAIDGNENGKYDILVLSQAVQSAGFADAKTALDTAFGKSADKAAEWFNGVWEKHVPDSWDGTADTTWYNDTDTEFTLTTAEQFAGLAELVDGGNNFAGKTVKLGKSLDLYAVDANGDRVSFDPIGYGYNVVFKGTFDGQNYTISNLYQNGWALGLDYSTEGGGLFASVVDATIKNLTIDKSEIVMECIDMGTLVGYSYGTCTYENITVSNSIIANYNRYTGGVIGEVNGTQTFKNVDVIDTTVSALWGTYDAALGGIIGGKWGEANLTFEDCDVSAKLDAFNDACSNYQYYNYRLCGMLIGMSQEVTNGAASAPYLTCKNCTVTYGDWANYTYCEFEANGQGSYNAPDEWKFSRVQEGYATDGVDSNHTHDTDESHEELLVFDQLFGGDKGVKGGTTHDGVTVIYNN